MLFDFHSFVEDLRQKPEKKKVVDGYEKLYGPISGSIQDQIRYIGYVAQFQSFPYLVPEELEEDFDRNLLIKLVASSFSSDGVLEGTSAEGLKELIISVKAGEQFVVKKVSELWSFQVLRLYEIYIEEQMNLQTLLDQEQLATTDEEKEQAVKERSNILLQRDARIQRRKIVMQALTKDEDTQAAAVEKEEKLGDLYSQL